MTKEEIDLLTDKVADGKVTWLSMKDICVRLCISRSTLTRFMRSGEFPKPIFEFGGSYRWTEEELKEWITKKMESKK